MNILACDPGELTGLAVIDGDFKCCWSRAVSKHDLKVSLSNVITTWRPDHAVIETPPYRANGSKEIWYETYRLLLIYLPNKKVLEVSPGTWKPLTSVLRRYGDHFATDHERDATYIARYELRRMRRLLKA